MRSTTDLTNKKFGRLTVIRLLDRKKYEQSVWECICDCGNTKTVMAANIKNGQTKSCGCLQKEFIREIRFKHGGTRKELRSTYHSWSGARSRCINSENAAYKNYGGRGIKMCDRWLNSFPNFLEDMGIKPGPEYSLDRYPNNDGDYELSNCRWATPEQQSRGKRSNTWIEYNGEKMILQDWANRLGIKVVNMTNHLKKDRNIIEVIEYYINNKTGTLWRNKK